MQNSANVYLEKGREVYTTNSITQFNKGGYLYVHGVNNFMASDDGAQLEFEIVERDDALISPAKRSGDYNRDEIYAKIPDEVYTSGFDVYCYVVQLVDNQRVTRAKIIMPIIPRSKPVNFALQVPNATEVLQDFITEFNSSMANNEQFKKDMQAQFDAAYKDLINKVTGTLIPTGTIVPYVGESTPSGFIYCDGRAIERSRFNALFAIIGTTFGSGDGRTTFNVPDLRTKFVIGRSTTLGQNFGTNIALSGDGKQAMTVNYIIKY